MLLGVSTIPKHLSYDAKEREQLWRLLDSPLIGIRRKFSHSHLLPEVPA